MSTQPTTSATSATVTEIPTATAPTFARSSTHFNYAKYVRGFVQSLGRKASKKEVLAECQRLEGDSGVAILMSKSSLGDAVFQANRHLGYAGEKTASDSSPSPETYLACIGTVRDLVKDFGHEKSMETIRTVAGLVDDMGGVENVNRLMDALNGMN